MDEKKEIEFQSEKVDNAEKKFEFQPEKVGDAELEKVDDAEVERVEKEYNFDLFTANRGKKVDNARLEEEAKARREAAKREKSALRQRSIKSTEGQTAASLPTDIDFGNKPEPEIKPEFEIKPEPEIKPEFEIQPEFEIKPEVEKNIVPERKPEAEKIQGIELDDDFQIENMLPSEPKNTPETNNAPIARKRPSSAGAKRKIAPQKEEKGGIAGYFAAHKAKVITTLVLAAIAIIGIVAVFSDMRMDIFGFTNNIYMMLILIFAVVLMVLCSFTKERHRFIHSLLWVLVVLIIAGSSAAFVLSGVCDFFGISRGRTISDFTIPEDGNWGTAKIAEELYEEGIINHPTLFRIFSKLKGNDGKYQWGNYELNSEMDYSTIMYNLKLGNTASTVKVRIPEGSNVDDIITILAENGVCTRDQFITAMDDMEYKYSWINQIPENSVRYRFEGYLYPDTYNFYGGEPSVDNAKKAIDKMLNGFNSRLPENWKELVKAVGERLGKNDMTLNDCMAVGSILELEASGNYNEMRNVASVFYNRLTWSEPKFLGSTPTYYYPDNRYNTNAGTMTVTNDDGTKKTYPAGSEGIPPGPQCSLTESSILACLQPADTSYTYFVTDKEMNFYYNKSYTAHLNTIAKLRREGKWA